MENIAGLLEKTTFLLPIATSDAASRKRCLGGISRFLEYRGSSPRAFPVSACILERDAALSKDLAELLSGRNVSVFEGPRALDQAARIAGKHYLVVFPPAGGYPPKEVEVLLAQAAELGIPVVGSRFMKKSIIRKSGKGPGGARLKSFWNSTLHRLPFKDPLSGFMVWRREVFVGLGDLQIDAARPLLPYLIRATRLGLTVGEVPVMWITE